MIKVPPFAKKALAGAALSLALTTGLIKESEGYKSEAYLDPVGIPTICWGTTTEVTMGMIKSKAECEKLLERDVEVALAAVKRLVKVPMTPERHAAMTDFAYNAGQGAFARSSLLKKLNAGDTKGACFGLLEWDKVTKIINGKKVVQVLKGLTKRRKAEHDLCMVGL